MHFVKDVKYLSEYKLLLTFEDDSLRQVDLAPHLDGEVFEPLKDTTYFQRFFVEAGTVSWPNGADIAPETLYSAQGVEEAA